MDFLSLLTSHEAAGFFITLGVQSILISITGLVLIKMLSKKPAPLRSLVCAAAIIAMGLLIVIFTGVRLADISWQSKPNPVIEQKTISDVIPVLKQDEQLPIQYKPSPIEPAQFPITQSYTPLINDTGYSTPALAHFPYSISLSSTLIILINILGFIWIIGVLFQLSRLGYGLIVVRMFKNSLEAVNDSSFNNMLNNIAVTLFRKGRIVPRLYRSSLIESPMAIGFIHPAIIIPEKLLDTMSDNELKSILLHEMAHIYHYDQITGIIKRFVIAFHWWNPFVYIINREHEQAREEVSDNYVLNELSPADYSRCLMNLAEKVSLISNIPFASGMAGKGFNLIKRVEQILSSKRSNAMNTGLSFKTIVFVCIAVLTFSIAGIHARVKSVEFNNTAKELLEPIQVINIVSITKEDQKPVQENILEPKAVNEADNLQSIPNTETMPQKELSNNQVQENKESVIVMASIDTKAMNKIEKPIDLASIQSSDEPELIKDLAENLVLAQNETAEYPDLKSAAVPDNAISNVTPEDAANDPKEQDIDTAIAEISRQIELNESDAGLYMLRGNLHMDKQDYEQAINDYTKAIDINPGDAAAYNNRGLAYVNMWEEIIYPQQAYMNKEEFEKAMKDNKQAQKDFFKQFMRNWKWADKLFFEKAIKDYKQAIKKDPENINAYINRGNAYFAKQSYKKAISDYTRAIKIDPEFSLAYINRGIAYFADNSFSNAIKDFSKAIELGGRDAGNYLFRGNAYYSNGELWQAINDYSKVLEINPDLINAYDNRGMAYEDMGELDKAIYDYSKAIEIISKNPDTNINPNFYSKVIQKPFSYYTSHVYFLNPPYDYNDRYGDYYNRRDTRYNHDQVINTLFIVMGPLASYIKRGLAYDKKGQLDKAISDFSRVIEIDPNNALAYLYRSKIYRKMGNEVEYKNDLNMVKKYSNEYNDLHEPNNRQGYWEGSPDSSYHFLKEYLRTETDLWR